MAANYVLLEKITVGAAGASSVTFSGIPQTGYTDLVLKISARGDAGAISRSLGLTFNGSSTGYSNRFLQGDGSSASSGNGTSIYLGECTAATATANTFGNQEVYIPNYTSSSNKSLSVDAVAETNATTQYMSLVADLWANSAAITSMTIVIATGNFVQGSTFYLYGVAKLGTTPAIVPYATGGDTIMTDGTYWYHAFRSSGTFTPAKGLSCDVLVVAGGGGGGGGNGTYGAGGGAGGVIGFASQSLASGTGYTATIGGGGAGGPQGSIGTSGSNSQFASLTAAVGGGYGGWAANNGGNGGSGGGAGSESVPKTGGTATSGQGNAGGNSTAQYWSGGGGGAGGAGGTGSSGVNGFGGAGTNTVTNWGALSAALTATGLGVSGYIAGGGQGAAAGSQTSASGGGGRAAIDSGASNTAGTVNTGSGGGGAGATATSLTGAAGGSGLVIVRYLV